MILNIMKRGKKMLHPSYSDLMAKVNSEVEEGEAPVVNSRYSIVLATSKRARQLIDGADPLAKTDCPKPLSIAVEELNQSKIRILNDEEYEELEKELTKLDEEEAEKARIEKLAEEFSMDGSSSDKDYTNNSSYDDNKGYTDTENIPVIKEF